MTISRVVEQGNNKMMKDKIILRDVNGTYEAERITLREVN
jgi:hypothetical protein